MDFGWIDFSREERDKALGVLKLLEDQGAVDELGIGIVRDAFADAFFPGTSTLFTRAKYLCVVPYLVRECTDGRYGWEPSSVMEALDQEEKRIARKMWEMHRGEENTGIVGTLSLSHGRWVKRAPSELYWNGIRKLGICREDLSLQDYVRAALAVNKARGGGLGKRAVDEDDVGDDFDAGGFLKLKPLDVSSIYRKNWRTDLDIALTAEEARFLKDHILSSIPDSVYAFVLRENIDASAMLGGFEPFATVLMPRVDERNRDLLELARRFMWLVYALRVRYNLLLTGTRNADVGREWEALVPKLATYGDPALIDAVFQRLNLSSEAHGSLGVFLHKACANLGDGTELDRLIRNREIQLKGSGRAKLSHPERFAPEAWVGGRFLDYRLADAARIIADIQTALGEGGAA